MTQFDEVKHPHPLIQSVQKRLWKLNKNWLAIITGGTGSGKSWSALSLADKIDPDFTVDKVAFEPSTFLEHVKNRSWGQGDVVVFDEAGAGMSAKEHMTKKNRVIDQVLQTFRRQNIGVIFTVPSEANVDKSVRRLLHTYMETKTIDYINERNHLKWLDIDYNRKQDKLYYHYPVRKLENGGVEKIKKVKLGKPRDKLVDAYEARRSRFQDKLNEQFHDVVKEQLEDKDQGSGGDAGEASTKKDRIRQYLDEHPDVSTKKVAKRFNTSDSYVSQVKNGA